MADFVGDEIGIEGAGGVAAGCAEVGDASGEGEGEGDEGVELREDRGSGGGGGLCGDDEEEEEEEEEEGEDCGWATARAHRLLLERGGFLCVVEVGLR